MDLETNLAKDFADAIRRGRMQHRMSQRLLAKAADVSQSTVCRLEQGDLRVSVGALVNVLTALGMGRDHPEAAQGDLHLPAPPAQCRGTRTVKDLGLAGRPVR